MEHRWNQRVAVRARAIVHHLRSGSYVGNVWDASSGGAYIELLRGMCPLNSPVTVLLPSEDDRAPMLQLPATVVRVDGRGIAVMFLEHDRASAQDLRRWLLTAARVPTDVQPAALASLARIDFDRSRVDARSS